MKAQLQGWVCAIAVLVLLCFSVRGARPVDGDELAGKEVSIMHILV